MTAIPTYLDLWLIASEWLEHSPVALSEECFTHGDYDEEEILWWLHWYIYKNIPKSQSNEWTFLYGDELSLAGDLNEKQFELRKLVIKVRNIKKRFLLQKTRFREENQITIDPQCIATVKNILSELDHTEEEKSHILHHTTKLLKPTIWDKKSLQILERLLEWSLEYKKIKDSMKFLQYINDNLTCPVHCLKSLLQIFSQKASQHQFKEGLLELAIEAIHGNFTNTLRLLLELELDPNSCVVDGESLIIHSYESNFMPGVKLLKKYGAQNPSLDEIREYQESNDDYNDYKLAQLNKILYPKGTTAPRTLKHLCIGSVRRLPNFEDKIKILPVHLQKNILTFYETLDE